MLADVGTKSVACFPLIVVEQPVGALYICMKNPHLPSSNS